MIHNIYSIQIELAKFRHAGLMMSPAIAEMETPSRIAGSDALGHIIVIPPFGGDQGTLMPGNVRRV